MKKFNFLLFILFLTFSFSYSAFGASDSLFYENFDDTTNINVIDSSTTGQNSWGLHWVNVTPPHSDSGRVMFRDTIYLITPMMDITGKKSVTIEFDHVAKVDQSDDAYIQISLDSHKTWITLTDLEQQSGSVLQSRTGNPTNYLYSELSTIGFGNRWHFPFGNPPNPQQIAWEPTSSSDFVHEVFEISNHLNNSTTNLTVRFVLGDNYNQNQSPTNPSRGRAGWYVDNIDIKGSECLLVAPEIDVDPPSNYINSYIGSVYWEGPYDFTVNVTDADGIKWVKLFYSVNGGPEDSILFNHQAGATYYAEIPGSETQIGDTVCWRIEAMDMSDCENVEVYPNPTLGCHEFEVRRNLPKGCGTTPKNDYPYVEDFNGATCVIGTSGNLCNDWTNASGDFGQWYVNVGNTPTPGTGASSDYPGGGKYLYLESDQAGIASKEANLKSPCLDFYEIQNPNVRFYVNTFGQSNGALHVDLITFEGPTVRDIIPPIPTSTTPGWNQVEMNLYQYRNKIVQLRFRGKSGFNNLSDISFDSLSIFNSPLVDIAAVSVEVDEFAPAGTQDSLSVNIRNLGVFPIDSMNIYLSYNELPFSTTPVEIRGVTINPSETKQVKLKANQQIPLGEYTVQAAVKLFENSVQGDSTVYNDTTPITIGRGLPTVDLVTKDEYYDSFEDTTKLWTAFPFNNFNTNRWQWGTPNYGQTTGAFDGGYAWDINLNTPVTNREEFAYLISPFMDLSASNNLLLQFQQNRDLDISSDLFFIEFSRDRGKTWETLSLNDPFKKNWTNTTVVFPPSNAVEGWNGTSLTRTEEDGQRDFWKRSEHDISSVADPTEGPVDEILFRFGFYDQANTLYHGGDGISIDAVRIIDMRDRDIAPLEIQRPYSNCLLGENEKVKFLVQNFGNVTFDSMNVEVNVYKQGQSSVDQTFTENVYGLSRQRRQDTVITLNNTVDLSVIGQIYIVEVITQLTHYQGSDQNTLNDTLRKSVENIDGCMMRLELVKNSNLPGLDTLGHHQFYINGKIPEYPSYMHHRSDFRPVEYYCARDSSQVLFELYDPHPIYNNPPTHNILGWSLYNDLIDVPIVDRNFVELENMEGGTQTVGFRMDCPPVRSTVVNNNSLRIIDAGILPTARNYNFELTWRNMGIEDIEYVEMQIWVDENHVDTDTVIFPSANTGAPITYSNYFQHVFSDVYVGPGNHTIMAVMDNPNELFDEEPWDDTARIHLNVVDTSYVDLDSTGYHTGFETNARPQWVSMNPYTYTTNSIFEKGTPSKTLINGAADGDNAWVTDLDDPYRPFDSSSVVSPYFLFEKDVCYSMSFDHLFAFGDHAQDGGNFQYSLDTGITWVTITQPQGDSVAYENWNNVHHIAAIPKNDLQNPADFTSYYNSGWSGVSDSLGSYQMSKAPLGFSKDQYVIFRFNFESDGPPNGEGWAIDNFRIDTISSAHCITVGLEELLAKHAFVLGDNKPNPFNSQTFIPVYLPKSGEVTVDIINMLGQPVYQSREMMGKGEHLIPIQSDAWSSGIYYYSVSFNGERQTKKMMITK